MKYLDLVRFDFYSSYKDLLLNFIHFHVRLCSNWNLGIVLRDCSFFRLKVRILWKDWYAFVILGWKLRLNMWLMLFLIILQELLGVDWILCVQRGKYSECFLNNFDQSYNRLGGAAGIGDCFLRIIVDGDM
jgi:hypothetical protein